MDTDDQKQPCGCVLGHRIVCVTHCGGHAIPEPEPIDGDALVDGRARQWRELLVDVARIIGALGEDLANIPELVEAKIVDTCVEGIALERAALAAWKRGRTPSQAAGITRHAEWIAEVDAIEAGEHHAQYSDALFRQISAAEERGRRDRSEGFSVTHALRSQHERDLVIALEAKVAAAEKRIEAAVAEAVQQYEIKLNEVAAAVVEKTKPQRYEDHGIKTVEEWNERVPVGIAVRYFPVRGEFTHIDSRTRSEAWALGHGAVVVAIEGKAGGVHIDHVLIVETPKQIAEAT